MNDWCGIVDPFARLPPPFSSRPPCQRIDPPSDHPYLTVSHTSAIPARRASPVLPLTLGTWDVTGDGDLLREPFFAEIK